MPKPRPLEVHVNSKGKKYLKLQELIHAEDTHFFLPVDAPRKTDLFNKGFLDGRKAPIPLKTSYAESHEERFVLAIEKGSVISNLDRQNRFYGLVSLEKTFLIEVREADRFIENICMECEYYGEAGCFQNDFKCAVEDRDRFRDSPHFEALKEKREERKRQTFPVTG
ncbi:hypothetical protein [Paenibacillus sp. MMO-177]|uniref:hypothetical protein n=1 Tax=Paenibacillus sp. MMO-177 TaxID=3081289 RepID=UPI0030161140